jgi:hypothetical protein
MAANGRRSHRRLAGVVATAAALAFPAVATPASTLVAQWHMDETTGTTMKDSAGSNPGTLHSVTLGRAGVSGTAYGFDGAHSYVTVPSDGSLNPGSSPITFTVHVRYTVTPPSGPTTDYDVLRKGVSATSGGFYKLEIRPDNRAICRFAGSSGDVSVHTGPALNDGNWHAVSCTRTAQAVTLTVDGHAYTSAHAAGRISNSAALVIGAKPGSDYYRGDLDEVTVRIG